MKYNGIGTNLIPGTKSLIIKIMYKFFTRPLSIAEILILLCHAICKVQFRIDIPKTQVLCVKRM